MNRARIVQFSSQETANRDFLFLTFFHFAALQPELPFLLATVSILYSNSLKLTHAHIRAHNHVRVIQQFRQFRSHVMKTVLFWSGSVYILNKMFSFYALNLGHTAFWFVTFFAKLHHLTL
jgi:hypothetical protein